MASVSDDPFQFVMVAFPWGEPGELQNHTGPDRWQRQVLEEIRDGLKTPNVAIQEAIASGNGVGKSSLVSWIILWSLATKSDTRGVVTANTEVQLRTKTWAEVSKWHRLCICSHWFHMTATAVYSADPLHERTWRIDAVPWSEKNPEAFAGLHNQGLRLLIIFDEASGIDDVIWEKTEGALSDADTQILWLVFGNPTRNTGRFKDCFERLSHRWTRHNIDRRECKIPNKLQVVKDIEDHGGEEDDWVRIHVRGIFPKYGERQFISIEAVKAAMASNRFVQATIYDPLIIGVDCAREGDDMSVIRFRRGRDARSIPPIKMREIDSMVVAAKIVAAYEEHQPDAVYIDLGNIGGGIVDRCRQLRVPVIGVAFGARADGYRTEEGGSDTFFNKRAEMWGLMKAWLKYGMLDNDDMLRDDLIGPMYTYRGLAGVDAVLLERKSEMRKRGLRSPDDGDALCLEAGTFVRTPTGLRSIEEIAIGDEIVTPFRTTKVAATWASLTDRLTTVTFSNGTVLRGKGEHKVFTWGNAATRLDALTMTDTMEPYGIGRLWLWRTLNGLSTEVRNTGFKKLVSIIAREKPLTASGCFIAVCGLITSDLSLKAMRFITRTAIGVTQFQTILRQCWHPTIIGCIWSSAEPIQSNQPRWQDGWSWPESRRRDGTALKRAWNGIGSTVRKPGKIANLFRNNVPDAEVTTGHSFPLGRSSARAHVRWQWLTHVSSRILENVRGAVRNSWRTVIGRRPVVPVSVVTESVAPRFVYNLTLEEDNVFYANDLLVYNCLTFAHPVQKSDHTTILAGKQKQGVESAYNPFESAWNIAANRQPKDNREHWLPYQHRS